MAGLRIFVLVCFLGLISLSAAQNYPKSSSTEMMMGEDASVGRKKKDKEGMEQISSMVEMIKSAIQTMTSVVSTFIETKSFGLSVINTMINLIGLVASLKSMGKDEGSDSSWDSNRRYATVAPHAHQYSYHPSYSDEKL